MPSASLTLWQTSRSAKLDEILGAHTQVGGTGPGRRYATEQINHAYTVLLASQFQGFCRDLHSECVFHLVQPIALPNLRDMIWEALLLNRSLDRGNANPGNLGADFRRLGVEFWTKVRAHSARNQERQDGLAMLNAWRNAIAHQDFDPAMLGGVTNLHLSAVRRWRRICDRLARSFDAIMRDHIGSITGVSPW